LSKSATARILHADDPGFTDSFDVLKMRQAKKLNKKLITVVAISGGFDPPHIGHVRYIQEASELADFLVLIANKDSWLIRKKGYAFQPEMERLELLTAISGIDLIVPWDDGSPNVCGAIQLIRPNIFAKGGDRSSPEVTPEWALCQKLNIKVQFNVGGGKIQSSSSLIEDIKRKG
jgi:cytidyltransferase-like protein